MERPSSAAGILEEQRPASAAGLLEDNNIRPPDGDADSGVDETTQGKDPEAAVRKGSRIPKKTPPESPLKRSRQLNPLDTRRMPRHFRSKSVPKPPFTTFSTPPSSTESNKKVPMNKIVVGATPSPNLKAVRSKIGSMSNANHRPGGGDVKIESRKLDWKTTARTNNINDGYAPGGGDKKTPIEVKKLSWNATSKVGSLDKVTHKPGGGTRKIESRKLEWNTDSKVGSKDNLKHKPGGGNVQPGLAERTRGRRSYDKPWRRTTSKSSAKSGDEADKSEDSSKKSTAEASRQTSQNDDDDNKSTNDDNPEENGADESENGGKSGRESGAGSPDRENAPSAPPREILGDIDTDILGADDIRSIYESYNSTAQEQQAN